MDSSSTSLLSHTGPSSTSHSPTFPSEYFSAESSQELCLDDDPNPSPKSVTYTASQVSVSHPSQPSRDKKKSHKRIPLVFEPQVQAPAVFKPQVQGPISIPKTVARGDSDMPYRSHDESQRAIRREISQGKIGSILEMRGKKADSSDCCAGEMGTKMRETILIVFLLLKSGILVAFLVLASLTLAFQLDEKVQLSDEFHQKINALKIWAGFFLGMGVINLGFTVYTSFTLLRHNMSSWHLIIDLFFFSSFSLSFLFFGVGPLVCPPHHSPSTYQCAVCSRFSGKHNVSEWLHDTGFNEIVQNPKIMIDFNCCGFFGAEDFQRNISWKHCIDRIENYGIYQGPSLACADHDVLPLQCCNITISTSHATAQPPLCRKTSLTSSNQGCKDPMKFWLLDPGIRVTYEVIAWLFLIVFVIQSVFVVMWHVYENDD